MLQSVILQTATRLLMALLLLLSIWLFIRGHNQPGGGFIGGLVGASASALYTIAYGVSEAKRALRIQPKAMIGLGLSSAVLSGLIALFSGHPFLTGEWLKLHIFGELVKLGTPMLFDLGVYLVVVGVVLMVIFALEEENV
ncbi:MAG: Na+/H+ antiporter subunit B [Deinococcales bacterium]